MLSLTAFFPRVGLIWDGSATWILIKKESFKQFTGLFACFAAIAGGHSSRRGNKRRRALCVRSTGQHAEPFVVHRSRRRANQLTSEKSFSRTRVVCAFGVFGKPARACVSSSWAYMRVWLLCGECGERGVDWWKEGDIRWQPNQWPIWSDGCRRCTVVDGWWGR